MEIYRTIRTSFWTDRKVEEEFTSEDKYFYLYLFTNPHTNLLGCYEIGIRQMSKDTGYDEATILKLLDRFENQHKVIKYNKSNSEMLILNWHKYNWTKSPKCKSGVLKQLQDVKTEEYKDMINTLYIPYIYPNEQGNIPYIYPINQEKYPIYTSNTNTNTNTNSNTKSTYDFTLGKMIEGKDENENY